MGDNHQNCGKDRQPKFAKGTDKKRLLPIHVFYLYYVDNCSTGLGNSFWAKAMLNNEDATLGYNLEWADLRGLNLS